MSTQLYFAYGSNMSAPLLAHRLGRADPKSFARRRGILRHFRLAFDKVSSSDDSVGYGNVVPDQGSSVEGVLNALTPDELSRLDAIELVPHHYVRRILRVFDTVSNASLEAHVYVAAAAMVRPGLLPTRAYLNRLLTGSDLLSPGYVKALSSLAYRDEQSAENLH